jgi:hypothetical protein
VPGEFGSVAGRLGQVLGQLGGTPSFRHPDETPTCQVCAAPMVFVAQFEGRDTETAVTVGGTGCGYAFACTPCSQAAFLWQ